MSQSTADPFAGGDTAPSVSFKDAPIGTTFEGVVTEEPKVVQSRDFETGDLATWPDGNPKMTIVLRMTVDGEERSVWAPIPSDLKRAITEAKGASAIEVGGTLAIRLTGTKPNSKNPRLNEQKLYAAKYTPPPVRDAFKADPADQWSAPAAEPAKFIVGDANGAGGLPPF